MITDQLTNSSIIFSWLHLNHLVIFSPQGRKQVASGPTLHPWVIGCALNTISVFTHMNTTVFGTDSAGSPVAVDLVKPVHLEPIHHTTHTSVAAIQPTPSLDLEYPATKERTNKSSDLPLICSLLPPWRRGPQSCKPRTNTPWGAHPLAQHHGPNHGGREGEDRLI